MKFNCLIKAATHWCLVLFFLHSMPEQVRANHAAGGALTYTHISGNIYRIHAIYYRDCLGIPAPG